MRAVVQRVLEGKVTVSGETVGAIGQGLVVFLGLGKGDEEADVRYMADKIANLRIFTDDADKMNLSLRDTGGELLAISQFTLYGDCRKGRRPSFTDSLEPQRANELIEFFVKLCRDMGICVATGKFAAHMDVSLINHGPVTMLIDSKKNF